MIVSRFSLAGVHVLWFLIVLGMLTSQVYYHKELKFGDFLCNLGSMLPVSFNYWRLMLAASDCIVLFLWVVALFTSFFTFVFLVFFSAEALACSNKILPLCLVFTSGHLLVMCCCFCSSLCCNLVFGLTVGV